MSVGQDTGLQNNGLEQMGRVGAPAARAVVMSTPHSSTQCSTGLRRDPRTDDSWIDVWS